MTTIIPYFDPILGKLRNSDVALISLATLIVPDPLVVNNLVVNSNATINTLKTISISNSSTITSNLISTNGIVASTATIGTAHISNIDWNLTSGATAAVEGQMNWVNDIGTTVVGLAGGTVDVALGMENVFPKRVRNSTGSTMPKGTAVYINGVSGNTPTVARAIATSDMTSAYTLGLTAETINDGATGWVTTFGEITGIDLSSFTAGNTLYLSGATAGYYTNQRPYAPTHYVRIGTVVKATADGVLVVNVINGFETDELHDVSITSLASGQILQSGATNLWYNRSFASAFAETVPTLSLGSLAVQNSLSYYSLDSRLSLGSLAVLNEISYTSLTNLPSLGSLAVINNLSYYSLDSRLSLGSLAVQNNLSYYSLDSRLSLGSLAVQNNLSYYSLDSILSLGSLAVQNNLSYYSLDSRLSLGSLAVQNNLSYYSLDSRLSLGSLAVISNVASPLALSGPTLTILQPDIIHNNLGGLTLGDPHTQYALLGGRVGGQNLIGGTGNNEILFFQANTALSNTATNDAFRWRAGQNGGNTRMILRHDGALGVNNTSPDAGLHVTTGLTAVAGYEKGLQVNLNINKTTGDAIGAYFEVSDVAGGVKTIYGHRARIYYSASTTISGVQATSNQAYVDGGGTVNALEVLTSNLDVTNNSTVVDAKLIRLFAPTVNTGGSIGTLMGLAIPNLTQGATNYSIYSEGGNMYHAGKIGIGTTTNTGSNAIRIDNTDVAFNRIAINNASTAVTGWGGFIFTVNDAFSGGYYRDNATADLGLWTQGNGGAPRVIVKNATGYVGILDTAPAGVLEVNQTSTTAAVPTMQLVQSDVSEEFINFSATPGATNACSTAALGTYFGKVRVGFNGVLRWLPVYN